MCGFGGVVNRSTEISTGEINEIARDVCFRGPDSTDSRIFDHSMSRRDSGNSAFFFNRLAIIDLNPRSNQPFEKGDQLLIFNGEIYNYKELRDQLVREGISFETESDTEVLFYLLKIHGAEGIKRLNGMFAFFWIDKKTKRFILSRDRIGIKPVYYSQVDKSFVFSSELHSIVRLSGKPFQVDPRAIDMYWWMQHVPTPFTIIKGICKLEPGSYIEGSVEEVESGKQLVSQPYWDAYAEIAKTNYPSKPGDLEQCLVDVLKRQLNADVPLGLFLSSGVDSSLLAALVNKHFATDKKFNFFTVGFTEKTEMDESSEASDFLKQFHNENLVGHKLLVDPNYVSNYLDKLYNYYDEPFADYSSLITWAVSRKAKEHVTVAISGDGADELFWGYDRYRRWEKLKSMQVPVVTDLMRLGLNVLPSSSLKNNARFALEKNDVRRHYEMFLSSGLRFHINNHIVNQPIWSMKGVEKIVDRPGLPAILDLKTYLADTMLYKVDRASMAASLEVRVPFLDNEVIDFALNLSLEHKSNQRYKNKAILKELLVKLAPHYDAHKKKRGFTFPMHIWLRKNWRERVLSAITRESLSELGLEPSRYLKLVHDFYYKDAQHFTDVWTIYSLVHWHQTFKKLVQ